MKLITFAVPCYNSQDYMRKCIESLLPGGEEVEIIIINDGSTDDTFSIAKEYALRYPSIVRLVDKPNGGHGSGVNVGLRLACGLYYKVVDSDDWVDGDAFKRLLTAIRTRAEKGNAPDLFVVNYVYEHAADQTSYVSAYRKQFPTETLSDWSNVKSFHFSHMLLMHALVFRTKVLRESGLVLPEHTFYVDDIFSYNPLPCAKSVVYLDIDFYRYFIGRADQSVNIVNMVARWEQQVRVMREMIDRWTYADIMQFPKGLRRYMIHALANYMMTTELFLCAEDTPERRECFKELWQHFAEKDKKLCNKIRFGTYVLTATILPWKLRGFYLMRGYRFLCRHIRLG